MCSNLLDLWSSPSSLELHNKQPSELVQHLSSRDHICMSYIPTPSRWTLGLSCRSPGNLCQHRLVCSPERWVCGVQPCLHVSKPGLYYYTTGLWPKSSMASHFKSRFALVAHLLRPPVATGGACPPPDDLPASGALPGAPAGLGLGG